MPKKGAKKLNPEKEAKDYTDFINTEEYTIWNELSGQRAYYKELYKEISTTTPDITEPYEPFFDNMFRLVKAFKVKTKLKEFKYEHFRSFFYGGSSVGFKNPVTNKIEMVNDGETRFIDAEDNNAAEKARHGFLDVYNMLDDMTLNELGAGEGKFYEIKKKMKDALTNFVKPFETHIKKYHKKIIDDVLADFQKTLNNFLTSNFQYSLFEYEHQDARSRKLNDFKEQALMDKFCLDLQKGVHTLYNHTTGPRKEKDYPNLNILAAKFKIEGWEQNNIQSYFIKPLFETWVTMRKEMNRLWVFGPNHWVVPLEGNVDLVKIIDELIDNELIAERVLGSQLKRDQLNFLFNTILYIFNTPVKDKLLADKTPESPNPEHEIVVDFIIPKLTVLRYLDHIVRITKAKRADVLKQERMQEYAISKASKEQVEQEGSDEDNNGSPSKSGVRDVKTPFITAVEEEDTEEDIQKFSRYWIWADYFPENLKDEVIKGAEMLRNINVAIRQDLADDYINAAMKVQTNAHKGRADLIKKKKEKAEILNPADKLRPPFLWNHTDIIEVEHEYRSNARPYDAYLGSRVKEMNNQIEFLASELRSYQKNRWDEIVNRVIGYFRQHRDDVHTEILNVKLPQTF